jgi:hypothetical protein
MVASTTKNHLFQQFAPCDLNCGQFSIKGPDIIKDIESTKVHTK